MIAHFTWTENAADVKDVDATTSASVKDISAALRDSRVERNVLGVNRDDIAKSREKINDWLKEIGY
ncbi:MAG: hypothetical protein K2N34_07280 [Lachnospiraceae bacterium]|nr:hypothetical protein [Lachnospiraceae bacterium]